MTYYIIENQHRPDGLINTSTTARQTLASALSYYYDKVSNAYMTELYTSVAIALVDENLEVRQHKIVETQYKQPVEDEEVAEEE